eukprot:GHVT01014092.1.p1 GENE.GHVT01014092.1~~GHVT01014092.1.p1  ORF type:complete len:117 (-),score=23.66 GHVT01014092.1:619-969(-)
MSSARLQRLYAAFELRKWGILLAGRASRCLPACSCGASSSSPSPWPSTSTACTSLLAAAEQATETMAAQLTAMRAVPLELVVALLLNRGCATYEKETEDHIKLKKKGKPKNGQNKG